MPKGSSSPPPAADPKQVAQQQSLSNVSTSATQQAMNQVNQNTPYGSVRYDVTSNFTDPSTGMVVPKYTATTTLSPEQQKLYEGQVGVQQGTTDLANKYVGRIADATSKPYNYDGLPAAPTYNEDYRKQQLGAIEQRNQPQMDRDRANLEQRLAEQGVGVQDPAYKTAMDQYGRQVNDFRLGADVQAGNAAAQQYGLEGNTRDRAISEMTNLRTQPINEVASLLGNGGVRDPTFVNTPGTQIAPTDVTGAYNSAQQQQMQQYQIQQQQNAATTGGLFGLGGTVLGAGLKYGLPLMMAGSDVRMKDNIRHVGHTNDGQRLYYFTYKHDPATPHIGLMAQEVEQIRPEAVHEIGGMKYVDYARALS